MKSVLTLFFAIALTAVHAQVNTFYVKPIQTDLNYAAVQDSSMVVRNSAADPDRLFLFLGGTGSNTQQYQTISDFAGNLGYDVINLAYPNDVAAASLADSPDSLVFDKYRQEVCYGTPESPDVSVDTLNSIYTRTVKLINYLNTAYPTQNWNQYLTGPTTLDWSKILVGGHSQGGGHAAYFAKHGLVSRVLMFSGPNDFSDFYANAASWMRAAGVTPPSRFYAYESLLDEFVDFNNQLVCLQGLGLYPLSDTAYVDNASPPYSNSHILYTTQSPGIVLFNHNVTVKNTAINNAVWEYMLTSTISLGTEDPDPTEGFSVFPNPATSILNIKFPHGHTNSVYEIRSVLGELVASGRSSLADRSTIDVSGLPGGIYVLSIDNCTARIVKQ